ncbi:hypothetical protein AAFF_G00095370 [Aldrovandia affinis]|uniref:ZP-C domain-containing protein n=1 Tax=Aldrovandia affinis TaxID=143900 RepID=A0AAD7RVY7_9TELE|nr:hypothetical protein AAFF_G00095370 [Aldrovandia affinis]
MKKDLANTQGANSPISISNSKAGPSRITQPGVDERESPAGRQSEALPTTIAALPLPSPDPLHSHRKTHTTRRGTLSPTFPTASGPQRNTGSKLSTPQTSMQGQMRGTQPWKESPSTPPEGASVGFSANSGTFFTTIGCDKTLSALSKSPATLTVNRGAGFDFEDDGRKPAERDARLSPAEMTTSPRVFHFTAVKTQPSRQSQESDGASDGGGRDRAVTAEPLNASFPETHRTTKLNGASLFNRSGGFGHSPSGITAAFRPAAPRESETSILRCPGCFTSTSSTRHSQPSLGLLLEISLPLSAREEVQRVTRVAREIGTTPPSVTELLLRFPGEIGTSRMPCSIVTGQGSAKACFRATEQTLIPLSTGTGPRLSSLITSSGPGALSAEASAEKRDASSEDDSAPPLGSVSGTEPGTVSEPQVPVTPSEVTLNPPSSGLRRSVMAPTEASVFNRNRETESPEPSGFVTPGPTDVGNETRRSVTNRISDTVQRHLMTPRVAHASEKSGNSVTSFTRTPHNTMPHNSPTEDQPTQVITFLPVYSTESQYASVKTELPPFTSKADTIIQTMRIDDLDSVMSQGLLQTPFTSARLFDEESHTGHGIQVEPSGQDTLHLLAESSFAPTVHLGLGESRSAVGLEPQPMETQSGPPRSGGGGGLDLSVETLTETRKSLTQSGPVLVGKRMRLLSPDSFLGGLAVIPDDTCGTGNYTAEMTLSLERSVLPGDFVPALGSVRVVINLSTNNSLVNLAVQSCCLSPSVHPSDLNATCSVFSRLPVDSSGIRLLPSNLSKRASFTINLFQMINYSTAYLHCDVSVCLRNHAGCARVSESQRGQRNTCMKQCLQRRRSSSRAEQGVATVLTNPNRISFGPLLKGPEFPSFTERTDAAEEERMVVALATVAGCSLATVALLLLWLARRRRMGWRSSPQVEGACCLRSRSIVLA